MRVLVIEDDPTVGAFVKRGLEEQRWTVDLVADGAAGEALATILLPAYFSGGALTLAIYVTLIALYFAITWLAAQERETV